MVSENKLETKSEVKSESTEKVLIKPEVKAEVKSELKVVSKPEIKKDFKRDFKSKSNFNKRENRADEKWGILHIYSSYNNTHLHVTDVTGSETIIKVTGGMVSKSDRLKASPNVAFAAAKQISESCLRAGYNCLYVKLRAVGGHNGPMTSGPGAQAAIRMLTRYGIRLGRIEDVTPVPHDTCRKKGGRRGRRV